MTTRCEIVTDAVLEVLSTMQEPEGRLMPRIGPDGKERLRAAIHRALVCTLPRTTTQER